MELISASTSVTYNLSELNSWDPNMLTFARAYHLYICQSQRSNVFVYIACYQCPEVIVDLNHSVAFLDDLIIQQNVCYETELRSGCISEQA